MPLKGIGYVLFFLPSLLSGHHEVSISTMSSNVPSSTSCSDSHHKPMVMRPNGHGLNSLKSQAKINLFSFSVFLSVMWFKKSLLHPLCVLLPKELCLLIYTHMDHQTLSLNACWYEPLFSTQQRQCFCFYSMCGRWLASREAMTPVGFVFFVEF